MQDVNALAAIASSLPDFIGGASRNDDGGKRHNDFFRGNPGGTLATTMVGQASSLSFSGAPGGTLALTKRYKPINSPPQSPSRHDTSPQPFA
jgi:hypothetical protein